MTEPTPQPEQQQDDSVPADSLELPHNLEAAKQLRAENRNLRERLRAAETDLEAAVTRLDGMRISEVQRVAAEHLVDPADIWSSSAELAGLSDGYGMVDPAKVAEAAQALIAEKPHLGVNYSPNPKPPTDRPLEALRPGASPPAEPQPTPTWGEVLSRQSRPSGLN